MTASLAAPRSNADIERHIRLPSSTSSTWTTTNAWLADDTPTSDPPFQKDAPHQMPAKQWPRHTSRLIDDDWAFKDPHIGIHFSPSLLPPDSLHQYWDALEVLRDQSLSRMLLFVGSKGLHSGTHYDQSAIAVEARIDALREMQKEEGKTLSNASILAFAMFWRNRRSQIKLPVLVATDDGHVVARWQHSTNHLLRLEFINESAIRYTAFTPSQDAPGGSIKEAGLITMRVLLADKKLLAITSK